MSVTTHIWLKEGYLQIPTIYRWSYLALSPVLKARDLFLLGTRDLFWGATDGFRIDKIFQETMKNINNTTDSLASASAHTQKRQANNELGFSIL